MSVVYWPARNPVVTEEAGTRNGEHSGIDLAAALGDPVLAPFDGTAVFVGGDGASGQIWVGYWLRPNGEGKTVDIRRDDGLISRVGHLNAYAVRQGDRVKAGQVIGYAGNTGYSTGVHIHWETRWDRAWSGGNWINPRRFNPQTYKTIPTHKPNLKGRKMLMTYFDDAGGKGKRHWAVFGPNFWLELVTQKAANDIAKQLGFSAFKTDAGGWEKYKRVSGG